jgi:hypothetical protein
LSLLVKVYDDDDPTMLVEWLIEKCSWL